MLGGIAYLRVSDFSFYQKLRWAHIYAKNSHKTLQNSWLHDKSLEVSFLVNVYVLQQQNINRCQEKFLLDKRKMIWGISFLKTVSLFISTLQRKVYHLAKFHNQNFPITWVYFLLLCNKNISLHYFQVYKYNSLYSNCLIQTSVLIRMTKFFQK